ncbi:PREDICTED: uncharacterized protein LOC109128160 [Camelina sativa]|uniref:S-protein homolog n=1 Tax=Camelina sativa TaxID=90675 RepID=A0ABM1QRY5_CAMSA|nr:PREDICTED: uncharacterized protein LOC109128160 [Camelina sativa]
MCGSYAFNILFSVIFMVVLFGCLCEVRQHIDVLIINGIGPNIQLGLHCKSKHKDLGLQSLAPYKSWRFREAMNFWKTTLFFCHFEWESESKWFDILLTKRNKNACKYYTCQWYITPDGPCRFTEHTECYPWNANI